MPTLIALVATRALTHHGAVIAAGVRFEALPIEAAALKYQGKARLVEPGDELPPPTPDPPAPPPTPTRPRRSATPAGTPKTAKKKDPRASAPRRRRRDLQPDHTQ